MPRSKQGLFSSIHVNQLPASSLSEGLDCKYITRYTSGPIKNEQRQRGCVKYYWILALLISVHSSIGISKAMVISVKGKVLSGNSVFIYTPLYCVKPVCDSFFCETKRRHFEKCLRGFDFLQKEVNFIIDILQNIFFKSHKGLGWHEAK